MPLPGTRPGTKPGTKPGIGAGNRPGNRPGAGNRPGTGTRPGVGNRPGTGNRPGVGNRPGAGNRPAQLPKRPGQNTRPVQRPNLDRPGNRPGGGNWWNSGNIGSGNNNNITINNNFRKNVNWSTNRRNWGYNPWWNRPAQLPWYGGSWNCGWNRRYYGRHHHYHYWPGYYKGPSTGEIIGWGLVGWGLGKLIFDSGYNTYSNPYPAQPVGQVTYTQPITVVAADTAPADEAAAEQMAEQSNSFIVESQEAFKQRDYLKALDFANKAVEESPGDGALHEYRALVLFSLGKYGEAAGVLNPILAGGPGWDWTTMVTLYDSQETYTDQLQKLEQHVEKYPKGADVHFLLGYHYMVCGHIEAAQAQFAEAAKLQPSDTISKQMADLLSATSVDGEEDKKDGKDEEKEAPADMPQAPVAEAIPVDQLAGTWVADKGDDGTITLSLNDDGKFTWNYSLNSDSTEFGGEYSMNNSGLLVLDADDSQMVGAVEMPKDDELKFTLAGGPPGDPGLEFDRK